MQNADARACLEVLKFHKKVFLEEKYEVGFVLFTAVDGEKTKNHLKTEQAN